LRFGLLALLLSALKHRSDIQNLKSQCPEQDCYPVIPRSRAAIMAALIAVPGMSGPRPASLGDVRYVIVWLCSCRASDGSWQRVLKGAPKKKKMSQFVHLGSLWIKSTQMVVTHLSGSLKNER
jgi:hypothetical protein